MRLIELLDNPVPYKKISGSSFTFTVGNIEYIFVASSMYSPAEFVDKILNKLKIFLQSQGYDEYDYYEPELIDFIFENMYTLEFHIQNYRGSRESGWDVMGTGNQFTVFSTVVSIIENEILSRNSLFRFPIFEFSAKEKSRIKLYNMFVKRLGSKFKNVHYLGNIFYEGHQHYIFVQDDILMEDLVDEKILISHY